jgi:hypothetical protein
MTGAKTGLNVGLPRLNKIFRGLQEGRYYLIGAESNVGKTTTADYLLLMSWLDAKAKGKPIKIFYFSLEVSAVDKKAKWVSFFLYVKLGIIYSVDFILGRDESNVPDAEALANIKLGYGYVQEFLKDVYLYDHAVGTADISKILIAYYTHYGTIKRETLSPARVAAGEEGKIIGFESNGHKLPTTVLAIDHLGFLDGDNIKEAMDTMSKRAVEFKRVFGTIPLFVQQFSGDQLQARRTSMSRHGSSAEATLIPNRMDFGDSKYTFRDADYVFGLVKPRMFEVKEYHDFDLSHPSLGGMGDFFMIIFLIKNRYGMKDVSVDVFLHPANFIYELPTIIGQEQEWYDLAKTLSYG